MKALLLLLLLTQYGAEAWFSFGLTRFHGCYQVPSNLRHYAKSVYVKGMTIRAYKREHCKGPKIPDARVRRVLRKHRYISSESASA